MPDALIEVKHLGKIFGDHEVLKDVDFSVKAGDVTCIIGPSGSGKSTLLRCINLFETRVPGKFCSTAKTFCKRKNRTNIAKRWAWFFSRSICFPT